jgi:hypothetical protein
MERWQQARPIVAECKEKMIALLRVKPLKDLTVGSILTGLVAICLLTLAVLYGVTIPHRTRAREFLHRFTELKLGSSTFADAQQLAREFRGIPWYVTPSDMTCAFQRCELAFHFDNMPLSYVPTVGYTRFLAFVHVKNGIVDGREIDYETPPKPGRYFRYTVYDFQGALPKGWAYGVWRLKVDLEDPDGVPHVLQVNLGPSSSESLRERAYSVDLSCLAKFYGCGSASAAYPSGLSYLGPPSQGLVPDEQ